MIPKSPMRLFFYTFIRVVGGINMSLFSSPQAASGRRKELRSKACFGSWKKKSFYQKMTPKGMLTASGVYMDIVLEMQNQQRWADSTCRLYDNLFWKYVAKIFESIDFPTLTEKEAENIWLEKINVFAGNEEADQRSRRLFEVLVECARVKGLTTLTFKNFYKDGPFELPDDIQLLTPAQRVIVRRAAEKFKQRLKSLTIESAIKIYRELLKQAPEKGECIALLMMLLLALRTAEAGGLSFGDIRKMEKDEYSIERRFVLDGDTRRIIEGSKTDNGYRLLPLVKELYNLLEERRRQAEKYLKAMGIKKDIDTLPLACHGKDFLTRCTKKEINNVFKDVCKKVGVLKDFYLKDEEKQEIFFEIKAMMLIDQEACQEYDGTVVAYLLRHQAATELALTSASREAISVLMGHKIENPNVKSFDFSNIEGQRELRDILMRRPLYRYICNKMDVKEIPAQAGTHMAYGGSIKVISEEDGEVDIYIETYETNDELEIQISTGEDLLACQVSQAALRPYQNKMPLSMENISIQIAALANERVKEGKYAEKPQAIIMCDDPLAELATIDNLYTSRRPRIIDINGNIVSITEKDRKNIDKKTTGQATVSNHPHKQAICKDVLILICGERRVREGKNCNMRLYIPESNIYPCAPQKKNGKGLGVRKEDIVKTVQVFQTAVHKVILSRDGRAWNISKGISVEDFVEGIEWEECRAAMGDGAVLISCPDSADSLVCVAENGRSVRLPLDKVVTAYPGSQIVRTDETCIIDACCCSESDELLYISRKGKAMRVAVSRYTLRKDWGCGLVDGMNIIYEGDMLCRCLVYQPERSLTVISQQGKLLALLTDREATKKISVTKGVTVQGVDLMRLSGTDVVVDALYAEQGVIMLTNNGKARGYAVDDITRVNRNSSGITGIAGQVVRAVEATITVNQEEK